MSVEARDYVEVIPDEFVVGGTLRARADDAPSALAELAEGLERVRTTIPMLEGLERVSIEASSAVVKPRLDTECLEKVDRFDDEMVCDVVGYVATAGIDIHGRPTTAAGNVLSLTSELGFEEVELSRFIVSNPGDVEAQAQRKAFDAAKSRALQLAEAADVELGSVVRLGPEDDRRSYLRDFASSPPLEEITVTANARRQSPTAELELDVGPVKVWGEVYVVFAIHDVE
ncbi:MAG: SIMPL domain-containing protein [Pseudomonadota bacterium]